MQYIKIRLEEHKFVFIRRPEHMIVTEEPTDSTLRLTHSFFVAIIAKFDTTKGAMEAAEAITKWGVGEGAVLELPGTYYARYAS